MRWAESYVGVPFVYGGLTRKGASCWGLVRLVLAEQRGVDVPTYGEIEAGDMAAAARAMTPDAVAVSWVKVQPDAVQAFDVLVMTGTCHENGRARRAPIHAGIFISAELVLHVEEGAESVIMPFHQLAGRAAGIYRHRQLAT